jgi:MFS family permease
MTTRSDYPTKWSPPAIRAHLSWLLYAPKQSQKALLAASFGWLLDSFDVMLYSLVLASLILDPHLHLSKQLAGTLGSLTLIAAAIGGLAFGLIADRFGRTRALMASVLIYAIFTAACGLAQSVAQLAIFRILLGFGMGGEWASGASLVAESFPDEHRGKALGLMQSSWAIGYALAALVVAVVMPHFGWRGVFFVGILPALLTLYIRRSVKEPAWTAAHAAAHPPQNPVILSEVEGPRSSLDSHHRSNLSNPASLRSSTEPSRPPNFLTLFRHPLLPLTLTLTAMNACCLFAWWGFNLWVPAYLSLPVTKGGIGLPTHSMTAIVVFMQLGMFLGYLTFGFLADRFGRKRTYVVYLCSAAALMLAFGSTRSPLALFFLAPFVAFTATGYFTGFAAVSAEIYETRIRSTAQGFTYNTGRIASAVAPFAVGSLADKHGFGAAFVIASTAFLLAAFLWFWIPETLKTTATAS